MRKLLLLLLGLLLIVLLSYYCFKTKTEAIENHLLSSVEERYSEESLDEIRVSVKGEDLNKTRILILTGEVNNIEEKAYAQKIAEEINGVYAVENDLRIKEKENIISLLNIAKPISTDILPPIKEVETEKNESSVENLVPNTSLVLRDRKSNEKEEEPIIEKPTTCEENLKEQLAKEKIHFEYSKSLIKKSSHSLLNGLVKTIKSCSKSMISIEGHSDSLGSEEYNQWLSQKRANAVKAYFIKHGIKKEKLKALGYGETKPIASNKTKAGQKLNRRIEFKIKGVK